MLIEDDYDMTIKDSSTVVKSVVEASSELEGEDHTKRKILDSCYVPVTVPGGYYGSSCKLLRVITERQSVNGETKRRAYEKYLVKQLPPTKMARRVFKHPMTFCKELYFYETLAPLYQQLAKIDFAPRYVWSRLSLPNYDAKAPHNDALLVTRYLEDFKMVDRYKGASFEDAKMVVHALAWFHATGIAIRHKRPDVYQQIQENFGFPIHLEKSGEARRDNVESMIDEAFRNETMSQIDIEPGTAEWLKETQKDSSRLECCYPRAQRTDEEADELSCLCHNDLWANNVMIRISHQQQPQQCGESEESTIRSCFNSMKIAKYNRYNDVRFVDWQTYYVSSPLTELVFFIFVTLELPLDAKKIDDLLAMYRETLICVTYDRYNIDLSRSLSDSNRFFERLRRDARDELYHIVKFVKIASLVENEDPFDPIVDPETIDRLRSIFKIYREKKWLKETPREVGARGQDPYLRHVRQEILAEGQSRNSRRLGAQLSPTSVLRVRKAIQTDELSAEARRRGAQSYRDLSVRRLQQEVFDQGSSENSRRLGARSRHLRLRPVRKKFQLQGLSADPQRFGALERQLRMRDTREKISAEK
ncbi:unnamed protein product [Trichogramma brassicae]|uniref:CHK kinase-like domain-containing protein n=1 Tax=Trichogramma brassicae TaxID=86971 RepID=A0A6H5IK92_9HYME|nr:unnamed protein product [Trichogramma brassicae]